MNVVITGANRGLGLGFVRHYLDQGWHVWASCRTDSEALASLQCEALHLLQWDVSQNAEPQGALPDTIDVLINNAGIYGPGKDAQSLERVSDAVMMDVFNVDCLGALRAVQTLQDRIVAAQGIIANISSKMGSSADNSSGGAYAYRAAKAALVIVSKSMAVDLAPVGVHVITLHPGWVRTDMTHQSGLIDIETSVSGMCKVIDAVEEYDAGAFVAFDGRIVPY